MSIRKWVSGEEKIIAGSSGGVPIPVGGIFESEGTTKPSYGTWVALEDRIEDDWREQVVAFTNAWTNAITNFKLVTKITEDKKYIDLFISFTILAENVTTTTSEVLLADGFAINGYLLKNIGFPSMVFSFSDANNASKLACIYYNNGSNKMWAGFNDTGKYAGPVNGRFLMPYNSAFTPTKTFHRWKREA